MGAAAVPGSPLKRFRPPGAPAGSWHHTPWWHCVFHDPYERINFWSHFIPGTTFFVTGFLARHAFVPGGAALWVFCCCAAITHLLSALTHVWPDSHFLEKLDHLGITALIIGTPFTQMIALDPHGNYTKLSVACAALLLAAFLPPQLRTAGFISIGGMLVFSHWHIVDVALAAQCMLYVAGGLCFVRNGGHDRFMGLSDHHLLHYKVTVACLIHIYNILAYVEASKVV
eukprot:GHRR01026449.1.p1 GENE.GHRR01026449.1~~GHRR01026449.1.p1  ORF type:complete len:228 (+),score=48.55 GHRR01026449.1:807-1490(+)